MNFTLVAIGLLINLGAGSDRLAASNSAPRPLSNPAQAFDFLEGTWTTVKDGLSLTLEVKPILSGTAWQTTQIVDDGNRVVATSLFTYDERSDKWTRTWFNNTGERSTFVGSPLEDDRLALEQTSFNGNPITPPQSRLLYTAMDENQFVLDWQSRRGKSWSPRPEPFVHRKVNRPLRSQGKDKIAFISKRSGNWEIFTMNPDGSDVQNLSNHPAGDHRPVWIAGGSRLAFRSQRARKDGGWDRWEVDLDGTDPLPVPLLTRLPNPSLGEFPEIHPSGSYAVNAMEQEGEQDLYIWRFDGGGQRVIAPATGLDYRPLFSPDGTRVLFISERDGNPELYSVGFDGSDLRRLTDSPGIDRYARWSPEGDRIAFVSDRDGNLEVYVMNSDGSDPKRLTRNEAEDGEVNWSPDGTKLVYRSDAEGNGEVCVIDLETGKIENLTRNDAYDGEPVWSPVR